MSAPFHFSSTVTVLGQQGGLGDLLAPGASDPSELLLQQPVELLPGVTHRHLLHCHFPLLRLQEVPRQEVLLGRKCLGPEREGGGRGGRGGSGAGGAEECRRVTPSLVCEVGWPRVSVGHVDDTLQPVKLLGRRVLSEVRPCSTLASVLGWVG